MKEPIDILYLITELNIGGAERFLSHLVGHLDPQRFRPTVACLYDGDTSIAADIRRHGIPVVDLEMKSGFSLIALWKLHLLCRRLRPTIVHLSLFHANLVGRLVGRLAGVPIVISCRQNISIGGALRERVNRLTVGLDDAVIAVCELAREAELKATGISPEQVVTIYNAIDSGTGTVPHGSPASTPTGGSIAQNRTGSNRLSPDAQIGPTGPKLKNDFNIPAEVTILGTVCRLHPQKGISVLLRSFAQLRKESPAVHLLVVGDGELRNELEDLANQLGLTDAVTFAGLRTDVSAILALLDIFVLPSLWEGLPVVILEAMAAGLPVVATDVGGVSEAVVDGETGLLVEPNQGDALAEAMAKLVATPEMRASLGDAGQGRVRQHFSIKEITHQTEMLYSRLLKQKGLQSL